MNPTLSHFQDRLSAALDAKRLSAEGNFSPDAQLAAITWAYHDPTSRLHGRKELLPLMGAALDGFLTKADARDRKEPRSLEEIYADPPMVSIDLYTAHHGTLMAMVAAARDTTISEALGFARMATIRASLDKHAAYWKALEKSPNHEQPWFYAMAVANLAQAYRYSRDEACLERASHWMDELRRCRAADGALEYMRHPAAYGGVYWYTDATLYELGYACHALVDEPAGARLVQEIGELARQLVPYHLHALISPGYTEYYSVIWWKHLTRAFSKPYATGALAYMSRDPRILFMAREGARRGYHYDGNPNTTRALFAGIWEEETAEWPEEAPDASPGSFYDANRVGIRGRYGRWNFTAQAGNHAGTIPGVTLLTEDRQLSAVLQRVTPIIRKDPDPTKPREDLHGLWILSWDPGSSAPRPAVGVALAGDFGVVASRYHPLTSHWAEDGALKQRLRWADDWRVDQLWITTPQRLLGLVRTTALRSNRSAGVALWSAFSEVSQVRALSPERYAAGELAFHLHENSYPHAGTAPSRATVSLPKSPIRWEGLYLTDEPGKVHYLEGKAGKLHRYHEGDTWHALIEISPLATSPAKAKVLQDSGALLVVSLDAPEGRVIAIFNHSDQAQVLTEFADLPGFPERTTLTLHRGVSGKSGSPLSEKLHLAPREALLLTQPQPVSQP